MGDKVAFGALLGEILFLLPAAGLLTLILLFWSGRRRRRGMPPPEPRVLTDSYRAVGQPPSPIDEPALAPEPLSLPEPQDPQAIRQKIASANERGDKSSLSSLYFELARAEEHRGDIGARMAALRSAAGCGALHGPHSAHAAARLALAEAAHEAGDLSTACEQWQMARTAFLDGGDEQQHARVERRMRENGCPTDWVLTDF
ncbi:MAG: hypothetical protein ABW006_06530 [Hyphomicrobium sp.]